ncbi:Conjugative relaxosome accessory transposon protein [Succinivibrio dextrinosolvens]|uniref:conjugal transfer protein TraH n=1 Tax=Succinivibrio dextrinosolvens TaxID=83771 RepID=UPI0008E91B6F|nr:conjugal transfer protein TraH [Succinivibrio dextrinosolvens]SFS32111.1 Conjugative relaxosome accessory transposon protein [Succinivibrio dextrinosolvens]
MSKNCLYIKRKVLKVSKISVVITCMTAMLAVSQPVYAKNFIAAAMDEYLGSMSNSTSAKAFQTNTRSVFSGGSFTVKNRVFNGNLVSFSPPSFKASCRGIDMFMGSFSFINADELIMLFRSIASNALGFLFKVALMVVSPAISEIMQKFSDIVREINKLVSDTCNADMGTTIRNVKDSIQNIGQATTGLINSVKNVGDNFESGFNQAKAALSFEDPKTTAEKTDPVAAKKMNVNGNMLWNAMKANYDRGIERPFNARLKNIGYKEGLEEIVLSMVGSIKVSESKADATAANNMEAGNTIDDIPSILDFETFVLGNSFKLYNCSGDNECKKDGYPHTDEDTSKKGFARVLYNQLCGTTDIDSPCLPGSALEKMVQNEKGTNAQKAAVLFIDPHIAQSLAKLQSLSAGASQSDYAQSLGANLVQKYIGTIALHSAHSMMTEILKEIRIQVSSMKNATVREALEKKIDRAEEDMHRSIQSLTKTKIPPYGDLVRAVKEHMEFYEKIPTAAGVYTPTNSASGLMEK